MADDSSIPSYTYTTSSVFYNKPLPPRIVVGIACVLSMTGSLLIIISYIISKELRSQTRWILLHLSFMDLGVALANFIGIAVNFDGYYVKAAESVQHPESAPLLVRYSCNAEAAVACFCTLSSILWTISIAVYLYFRIVNQPFHSERFYKVLIYVMYIINYGFPLLLTTWLSATRRLGFAPWDSSGWCTIIVIKPPTMVNNYVLSIDKLAAFFGCDMWVILTIIVIPVLYFSIKTSAKKQLTFVFTGNQSQLRSRIQLIDLKFTAIPLIFVFLRIWSLIIALLYNYIEVDEKSIPKTVDYILIFLSGIGDSSQGAVNGIIFVIFTQKAREIIYYRLLCCSKKQNSERESIITDDSQAIPSFSNNEESFLISKSKENSAHQKYESGGKTIYIIQSH